MNNTIPCCGTCRNSCGSGDYLYCGKLIRSVDRYDGCLMYESKEDEDHENASFDE